MPEYRGAITNQAVDTTRWDDVPGRAGDIIVATYAKMGTTWTQMLCALLVHGPELPRPLAELSPWLDGGAWDYNENAVEVFNAQSHRRIMKTHTSLYHLPYREDAFYVTCGRDPRDAFLSQMDHHDNSALGSGNDEPVDRNEKFAGSLAQGEGGGLFRLFDFVDSFWTYRPLPNILHLHYNDLSDDLVGEAMRLASFLGIDRTEEEIGTLVEAASFDAMRADADSLAPGSKVEGRWKRNADFFKRGRRGEWREVLTEENQEEYARVTREVFDGGMLDWVEGGRLAVGDTL